MYCQKNFNVGIYCFKYHKDVESCHQVPEDVKNMILSVLVKNQEAYEKEKKHFSIYWKKMMKIKGKKLV